MPHDAGSYEVRADHDANRLYVSVGRRVDGDDVALVADVAGEAARDLAAGFDAVVDVRGFAPSDSAAVDRLAGAHAALGDLGVDRVVLIASDGTSSAAVTAIGRGPGSLVRRY